MKTELTTEQSNHLIELGIPEEWASLCEQSFDDGYRKNPIFNLDDLLVILPSSIFCYNEFCTRQYDRYIVTKELGNGKAQYVLYYECKEIPYTLNPIIYEDELIDGLYKLLVWVIENYPKSIIKRKI